MGFYLGKSGNELENMSALVRFIAGGVDTSDADAVASDILLGKTGYVDGVKITGTCEFDADTSDANAVATDLLNGKSGYVNGVKVVGNIPSKAGQTYTPGTTNQTIAAGQYLSGNQVISGDADLIGSNIKNGVSIFNVDGTYAGGGGIAALVNSLSFTGTYATSVYIAVASCFASYAANGLIALVCKSGTGTSYENLNFTLVNAPVGVILVGKSSYRYTSELAGQYYVAILSGITVPVNIVGSMTVRNSSSDFTQIDLTITAV